MGLPIPYPAALRMTNIRSRIKRLFLGGPGARPRELSRGLLAALRFHIDTENQSLMLLGLYEREISNAIRLLASSCVSAIDVGAGSGWYTVFFASRPNLRPVLAIEPDDRGIELVRRNLALNVTIPETKFRVERKFAGEVDDERHCRIDTLAEDLPKPVLVKIDVEGAEVEVLRGAERLLASRSCALVVETHSPELERRCVGTLEAFDYGCRIVRPAWYRKLLPEHRPIPHNRWLIAKPNQREVRKARADS